MPHGRKADGMSDQQETQEPAQVDWESKYNDLKAETRKWEERSKANYDELQQAKSAQESLESRLAEFESKNSELASKVQGFEDEKAHAALVSEVAKSSGVDASALRGSTKEELEEHAETLKSLLKPSAPVIDGQAKIPGEQAPDPDREFVHELFGK